LHTFDLFLCVLKEQLPVRCIFDEAEAECSVFPPDRCSHVDSVKQVVTWARENMEQSGLEGVRWIVEDALKFVQREVRRGNRYNGIILDPPAYGRGANGEKWILEDNIGEMLECCARLLEPRGAFLVLNLYSMGLSATLASTAVRQAFGTPFEEQFGELCFDDRAGKRLPLGTYCRFVR
jgi:23S rRNA (cytosine1962-C5)-methyltransferase